MSTKHTPGPWTACVEKSSTNGFETATVKRYSPSPEPECSHIARLDDRWICEEHGGDVEANARLIAAAPELLDFAIQYLWSEHGICAPHHEAAPYTPEELRDICQAAIAKATGETVQAEA